MKKFWYWLNERKHLRKKIELLEQRVNAADLIIVKAAEKIEEERLTHRDEVIALRVEIGLLKDKMVGA